MSGKRLTVLGSTGSIGEQTLAVAAEFPDRFERGGSGRRQERRPKLAEQVKPASAPSASSVADDDLRRGAAGPARRAEPVEVLHGRRGRSARWPRPTADLVMSAIVGAAGLGPTLAAVRAGRDVALANKESLVMAGALVMREVEAPRRDAPARGQRAQRHLPGPRRRAAREDVQRLLLTASGGPFRTWSEDRIAKATREEALRHPNWDMGPKITIDSASLMNKGLEVIEARWLFERAALTGRRRGAPAVHRALPRRVRGFGSVVAQLGLPDMRVPIAVALAHPARLPLDLPRLDLAAIGSLDFESPDTKRFPCLDLAYTALAGRGEAAPAVLNAANEVAVAAFLEGGMAFPRIAETNATVLEAHLAASGASPLRDEADVAEADGCLGARPRPASVWPEVVGGSMSFVFAFVLHALGADLRARVRPLHRGEGLCGVRVLKFSLGFGAADRDRPLPHAPGCAGTPSTSWRGSRSAAS